MVSGVIQAGRKPGLLEMAFCVDDECRAREALGLHVEDCVGCSATPAMRRGAGAPGHGSPPWATEGDDAARPRRHRAGCGGRDAGPRETLASRA